MDMKCSYCASVCEIHMGNGHMGAVKIKLLCEGSGFMKHTWAVDNGHIGFNV